jgi:hypothetical protein
VCVSSSEPLSEHSASLALLSSFSYFNGFFRL